MGNSPSPAPVYHTTVVHEDNSHLKAEQERLAAAAQHDHDQKMKELEMQRAAQAAEHGRLMEKLKNEDRQKKRAEIQSAINRTEANMRALNAEQKQFEAALSTAEERFGQYSKRSDHLTENISNFETTKHNALAEYKVEIEYSKAKTNYNRDLQAVMAAINTTGQHEENVGDFLRLTHSLIPATTEATAQTNKLDAALDTFQVLLNNECQDELTIDYWFNKNNLERLVPVLHSAGYVTLEHLVMDEDAFYEDIIGLLQRKLPAIEDAADAAPDVEDEKDDTVNVAELEGEELAKYLLDKWKLSQFYEKLVEDEGWDDPEGWIDLTEDDLIDDIGMNKKGQRKRFLGNAQNQTWMAGKDSVERPKCTVLKLNEFNQLKQISQKPDGWRKMQRRKQEIVKDGLMTLCPVLGEFFGKMDTARTQCAELLGFNEHLNPSQKRALQMENENKKVLKALTFQQSANDARRAWSVHSKCSVYSQSNDAWYDGEIVLIEQDTEGAWLTVEYKTEDGNTSKKQIQRYSNEIRPVNIEQDSKDNDDEKGFANMQMVKQPQNKKQEERISDECSALITATLVRFNVTDTMISKFTESELTERGLTLAKGVESGCVRVYQSQGQMRQSVMLAQEILKYKPSHMNDEKRQELWKAIDDGIVQIFKSALEMVKVAAQYFGFFLRFQGSFQFYVSCYKRDPDTELMISLERLRKDVRDFNKFKANFTEKIAFLSKTAMDCIEECVRTQIGVADWDKSRESLKATTALYLEKEDLVNKKALDLDRINDKNREELVSVHSKKVGEEFRVKMLSARIADTKQTIAQCQANVNSLTQMLNQT